MLARELMNMQKDPVPGFTVEPTGDDLYVWIVGMFGPPDTIYEGAYFKARMKFPEDYPLNPPSLVMMQPIWHPNVYEDGRLCISILHPPGDDPHSGELASERWSPAQSVTTVLLSVISMLNEPNCSSPANVDASVMYRNQREEYNAIVKKQVEESKKVAIRCGVTVPLTADDYTVKSVKESAEALVGDESSDDDMKYVVECDNGSDSEMDDSCSTADEDDLDESQVMEEDGCAKGGLKGGSAEEVGEEGAEAAVMMS